jgi:hypothetical protein
MTYLLIYLALPTYLSSLRNVGSNVYLPYAYLFIDQNVEIYFKLNDINEINKNIKYQNKFKFSMCPLMICQHIIAMLVHFWSCHWTIGATIDIVVTT